MSKEFVVGRHFPEFTLKASSGETIAEKSFLGKKTIVFIYPKNDTSGCTKECIDFSNLVSDFKEYNTTVFGLSKDTHESHKKFIEKHNILYKNQYGFQMFLEREIHGFLLILIEITKI